MNKFSIIEVNRSSIDFDSRLSVRRIGIIALATDLTSERDFADVFSSHAVVIHTTRIDYQNPTTVDTLRLMRPRLAQAASLLVPGQPLQAICYSCVSASALIGDEAISEAIHSVKPGVPIVTPCRAALNSFKALGARRIALLTPYTVETSLVVTSYFEKNGIEVDRLMCLGLDDDREMARISKTTIKEMAVCLAESAVDTLFISCTAVQAFSVVSEIENRIGIPVVTANQASAFEIHRILGLRSEGGYGSRLFSTL